MGCGLFAATRVRADAFSSVHYDPVHDQLVVTMIYRGTNPNHGFSLHWGACRALNDRSVGHQIAADVLDDQWDDDAQTSFSKTVRFSLADLACRPAEVTLRSPPRFFYTMIVPERHDVMQIYGPQARAALSMK
jgi:hypothetical protein